MNQQKLEIQELKNVSNIRAEEIKVLRNDNYNLMEQLKELKKDFTEVLTENEFLVENQETLEQKWLLKYNNMEITHQDTIKTN